MASRTEVANLALGIIGRAVIPSIDDPGPTATTLRQFENQARLDALALAPWTDATYWLELARRLETPPDYAYWYAKPSRCVRVWRASTGNEAFRVERDRIACSEATLQIYATIDPGDFSTFGQALTKACAHTWASLVARPLGVSFEEKTDLDQRFMLGALPELRALDGQQNPSANFDGYDALSASWIEAAFRSDQP